jgi:hypothetical protein
MTGAIPRMDWPETCEIAPEVRREVEAEVYYADLQRQRRAAPPPARRRPSDIEQRVEAVERGLAGLRRSLTSLEPGSISDGLARAIGIAVADLRRDVTMSLRLDIAASEKRVTDPEKIREVVGAAVADLYRGIWTSSRTYAKGSLVVSDGSLWLTIKNIDCHAKPGTDEGHGAGWRQVARGVPRSKTSRS